MVVTKTGWAHYVLLLSVLVVRWSGAGAGGERSERLGLVSVNMLRRVFSHRPVAGRSIAAPLEAGLPRTVAAVVLLPSVATAAGMHYSADFRAAVEERAPGASDALSKLTGGDYGARGKLTGSTLPEHFEELPTLLRRIEKEKTGGTTESDQGVLKRGAEMAKKGAEEKAVGGVKVADAVGEGAKAVVGAAKSVGSAGRGGDGGKADEKAGSWFPFGAKTVEAPADAADALVKSAGGEVSSTSASATAHDAADKVSASVHDASGAVSAAANDVGDAISSAAQLASDRASEVSQSVSSATHSASAAISSADGSAAAGVHEISGMASSLAAGDSRVSEPPSPSSGASAVPSVEGSSGWSAGAAEKKGSTATEEKAAAPTAGLMQKLRAAKSAGELGTGVVGSEEGDKFSSLLGKGDFDPGSADGKEVVDVSVYRRPAWAQKKVVDKLVAPGTSNSGADSSTGVEGVFGRGTGKDSGRAGETTAEIEALQSELQSQAKWDAVRLQEAVRAQSVSEKKQAAAELAKAAKKHEAELAKVKEESVESVRKLLEEKVLELEADMIRRRDAEVAQLLKEREDGLKMSLESEYLSREQLAATEQEQKLLLLKASVDALHNDLDESHKHRQASQIASSIAASAFSLKDALQGNGSFEKELEIASRNSELGALVAATIPAGAGKSGVSTVEELKGSFASVAKEGRKAALVPEGDVGTIWGHLLASLVSRVKIAVDTGNQRFAPSTDEERILLAEKQILAGNLQNGIDSLSELSGLAAEITSDWVTAAKARIAADVGAQALLADAILSQQSLAASKTEEAEAPACLV